MASKATEEEVEELGRYLRSEGFDGDDCEKALGSTNAAPYVGAIRKHRPFKTNMSMPNKRFEVLVKEHPILDRGQYQNDGCWVSAWVWVSDADAVKFRLTEESETV